MSQIGQKVDMVDAFASFAESNASSGHPQEAAKFFSMAAVGAADRDQSLQLHRKAAHQDRIAYLDQHICPSLDELKATLRMV